MANVATPPRSPEPALLPGFDPQALTPASPLWAWAYEAISERASGMLQHHEGVRLGEDIEAVHDMRVGSRRLVAAMRVFSVCFPGRKYRQLLREARDVTRRLGGVRDLDVLLDHFARLRQDVGPEEGAALDYLVAQKRQERERARRPMLKALAELEASDYEGRVQKYLRREAEAYSVGLGAVAVHGLPRAVAGSPSAVHGETPFREAAPPLLEARYEALMAFAPYVEQPEAVEPLHEMRIAAKWFRYTMELFAPAYESRLKRPLGTVKRFQELLGDLHDSDVRRALLAEVAAAPCETRVLKALDLLTPAAVEAGIAQLQAREERTRRECFEAFRAEWRRQARRGFAASCLEEIRHPNGQARLRG